MKITVVGGLGYVGSALLKNAKKSKNILSIIDPNWFDTNLEQFEGTSLTLKDIRHVSRLPDGDVLIYLAAISNDPMGREYSHLTQIINANEAVRIAEMAKKQRYSKFIFASSCSVYGGSGSKPRAEDDELEPLTDYAVSKVEAEKHLQLVADEKMDVVCLRFATACGVSGNIRLDLALNDFVLTGLLTGNIKVLSDGTPWRPFIDVNDMAQVMLSFCEKNCATQFEVFNIGSRQFTFRMKDLAERVSHFLNCNYEILGEVSNDTRSYTVDFSKFENFFSGQLKLRTLEQSVGDLFTFYQEQLELNGKDYFSDFRENPKFIRLSKLKLKKSRKILTEDLFNYGSSIV